MVRRLNIILIGVYLGLNIFLYQLTLQPLIAGWVFIIMALALAMDRFKGEDIKIHLKPPEGPAERIFGEECNQTEREMTGLETRHLLLKAMENDPESPIHQSVARIRKKLKVGEKEQHD